MGIVLGSGLGGLADLVAAEAAVPYAAIPGFPISAVDGHANTLVLGHLEGHAVAVMRGRVHLYEGYRASEVAFPIRILTGLGVSTLIVSNAAGGLNRTLQAGDLMLLADHVNLPGLMGEHPLRGANDERVGPRFPDLNAAYDAELRRLALEVAAQQGMRLHQGVYAMVSGPSFETPAECALLRTIGADAVGMSTVPEVVVARYLDLRVLGVSLITNVLDGQPVNHQAVLATANHAAGRFVGLVRELVRRL